MSITRKIIVETYFDGKPYDKRELFDEDKQRLCKLLKEKIGKMDLEAIDRDDPEDAEIEKQMHILDNILVQLNGKGYFDE